MENVGGATGMPPWMFSQQWLFRSFIGRCVGHRWFERAATGMGDRCWITGRAVMGATAQRKCTVDVARNHWESLCLQQVLVR